MTLALGNKSVWRRSIGARPQPVFSTNGLVGTFHAMGLQPKTGPIVVDGLELRE